MYTPPAPGAAPPPYYPPAGTSPAGRQAPSWRQLRRPQKSRLVGGVAAAMADRLGVSPLVARAALVALSFAGGAGIVAYLAGWLWLPAEGSDLPIWRAAVADRRTIALVAAVASAVAAAMAAIAVLQPPLLLGSLSPGLVSLAALVAVWRHGGPGDRAALQRVAGQTAPAGGPKRLLLAAFRLGAGAGLVALGTSAILTPRHLSRADLTLLLAAFAVVAGAGLVLAPWWLRLARELAGERRQRVRAEERAEMASHLHDSVLQTLALIQRSAGDARQVQRLARAQERQLRSWLFDTPAAAGPGAAAGPPRLSAALLAVQQEVEMDHGLRAEVVTVGDAELDERLAALVAATREAVLNAAKWSGAEVVSVYAEVEPDAVSVFVRDRGKGFDPAAVAPDRKGLSESVHARTRRHGGTSSVRSAPGEGTEVALRMPRGGARQ